MPFNKRNNIIVADDFSFNSVKESNLFLRATWAELRSKFGGLAWQYTPHKLGNRNTISFGSVNLGPSQSIQIKVSVGYAKRGVVQSILFEEIRNVEQSKPELEKDLREAVKVAVKRMQKPVRCRLTTCVTTPFELTIAAYQGNHWQCKPISENKTEIGFDVWYFDQEDSNQEFHVQLEKLLDVLSFFTNVSFIPICKEKKCSSIVSDEINKYLIKEDWLDDFSLESNHLRLSLNQVKYCDKVISDTVEDEQQMKAARLFRKGLRLLDLEGAENDTAATLFVSSIEAISLPRTSNEICKACNQSVFSISRRVSEIAEKHLGSHTSRKFKKEYYANRSNFLHTGHIRASQPMVRHIIPQLDPNGVEGCVVPSSSGHPKNLLEFTSFILRREIEVSFNLGTGNEATLPPLPRDSPSIWSQLIRRVKLKIISRR